MSLSLSKASKPPLLFTQKASGVDDFTFVSAVARQWKMKELLVSRSLTGSITLNVYLHDKITNKNFLLATVSGTTASFRISPTLSTGEYFVDSDAEIKVEGLTLGSSETWDLRMTGSLVA